MSPTKAKKDKPKKIPSERMRKAAKLMAENGGGLSKGVIMKKAGYSEEIQNNPAKITNSTTFRELLDQYLPEDALANKHKELLEASDTFSRDFPDDMPDEEIRDLCEPHQVKRIYRNQVNVKNPIPHAVAYCVAIDRKTAKEALDMGYKLRGSYAPTKTENRNLDLTGLLEEAMKRMSQ